MAGVEAASEVTSEAAAGVREDVAGVLDLRGGGRGRVVELRCDPGDLVVVSGLPGSGKSTLIRRAVPALDARGVVVHCVDSQDTRERLERRLPRRLPYAVYRPLARLAHYVALRRALRSGTSGVVHDCGERGWVRWWLGREARRRGACLYLVVLDVHPDVALAGQAARGRAVSARAFRRHRRAMGRLLSDVAGGRVLPGVGAVVVVDRGMARVLRFTFGPGRAPTGARGTARPAPTGPRETEGQGSPDGP
ncbi:ATP-binding protein [Streptomyces griseocarneus]|nr:ATP-binding protein [Streptomyces griseocarneus]